jgi:hypothetical protein
MAIKAVHLTGIAAACLDCRWICACWGLRRRSRCARLAALPGSRGRRSFLLIVPSGLVMSAHLRRWDRRSEWPKSAHVRGGGTLPRSAGWFGLGRKIYEGRTARGSLNPIRR